MSCAGGCCGCQGQGGGASSSGIKQPQLRGDAPATNNASGSSAASFLQKTAQAIQAATDGGAR